MLASSSIAVATSERHTAFETRSATHTAIFKYTAKAPTECASNYSFKPRPLRGLAHALVCSTTLGRCAFRLNSGVRFARADLCISKIKAVPARPMCRRYARHFFGQIRRQPAAERRPPHTASVQAQERLVSDPSEPDIRKPNYSFKPTPLRSFTFAPALR